MGSYDTILYLQQVHAPQVSTLSTKRISKMKARRRGEAPTLNTWSEEKEERLVELWREHECLFDVSAASYHNRNMRDNSWRTIASALGLPGRISSTINMILLRNCLHNGFTLNNNRLSTLFHFKPWWDLRMAALPALLYFGFKKV